MLEAVLWGLVGASSLFIGAVLASIWKLPKFVIGLVTAFGVGVLISSIVIELVEKALSIEPAHHVVVIGLIVGSMTFFGLTYLLSRLQTRSEVRRSNNSSPLTVFGGTVLDGIPESLVLGLSLIGGGGVSAGILVAVFLSNLPEAMTATYDLKVARWKPKKILLMWAGVVVMLSLFSLLGYAAFDSLPDSAAIFTLSFAAGALITMIADAMIPEAYAEARNYAGIATTIGFSVAFLVSHLM